MSALTAAEATAMVGLAASQLRDAAPELSRLDAVAGDGDHGANVARTFSALEERLRTEQPTTPADVFALVGRTWAEVGGGAAGALFATLFEAIGHRLRVATPGTADLIAGLGAGTRSVQEIGRARQGDRTLLDALVPALEAATGMLQSSTELGTVLRAAATAAASGAAATAEMPAKAGRAKYSPEAAFGIVDAGAMTVAIMFASWADAVAAHDGSRPPHVDGPVGKLDPLVTPSGQFAILALDHVRSFAATMRPEDPDSMGTQTIWDWKSRLLEGLAADASAVLIDPGFAASRGATVAGPDGLGLIIGLEDSDYGAMQTSPRLVPGWTVERAAGLGADAIKVSFGFSLDDDNSGSERFVAELVRECARARLPLLCEPLASVGASAGMRRTLVEAVHRFSGLGVDVLKIQFPAEVELEVSRAAWADACAEVSDACQAPWALLSEGREFDQFRDLLTIACQAGASGFVAGRAIWGIALDHPDAIRESAARLASLRAIASTRGRPWRGRQADSEATHEAGGRAGPEAPAREVGQSAASEPS